MVDAKPGRGPVIKPDEKRTVVAPKPPSQVGVIDNIAQTTEIIDREAETETSDKKPSDVKDKDNKDVQGDGGYSWKS